MEQPKISQAISLPYSALLLMICGIMILSFPFGAYVIFNADVDNQITFEYPLKEIPPFNSDIGNFIPIEVSLGDGFIILWCVFLILFVIAIIGPKKDFMNTLHSTITHRIHISKNNYLCSVIQWFSILIIVSAAINFIQEGLGISIQPPSSGSELTRFFGVMLAPIIEEFGFRVVLIGIPLFAIYSHKTSFVAFLKSLWNPSTNLHIQKPLKPLILISLVAIFFGIAHVVLGEPWSIGKFTQATAGGIIIGWVYYKHGLISAILVHWATNYFIFTYVYLMASINITTIEDSFTHPLINSFEIIFLLTGILSILMLWTNYVNSKKEKMLQI